MLCSVSKSQNMLFEHAPTQHNTSAPAGLYEDAMQLLIQAVKEQRGGGDSRLGGDIQLWLGLAYQASKAAHATASACISCAASWMYHHLHTWLQCPELAAARSWQIFSVLLELSFSVGLGSC